MAAAFTKANILAFVRKALREPSARLYSDTEINAWIDEGAIKTSIITLCNENIETTRKLIEGDIIVPLKTNPQFIHIESVVVMPTAVATSADYGIARARVQAFGHGAGDGTAGPPRYWSHYGNNIFVWPAPASAQSNVYALYVYGYNPVSGYGAGGSEELPDEVQHFVQGYAMAMALTKAGKHSQSAYYLKRFIDECSAVRRDIHNTLGTVTGDDMISIPDQVVQVQ